MPTHFDAINNRQTFENIAAKKEITLIMSKFFSAGNYWHKIRCKSLSEVCNMSKKDPSICNHVQNWDTIVKPFTFTLKLFLGGAIQHL